MRHVLMAIIVTAILVVVQVALFGSYPFALISFCGWIWWKGSRVVIPWAAVSSVALDMYTNTVGVTIFEWCVVLCVIAVLSSTVLTNRSLISLLAVVLCGFVLGSTVNWGMWYLLSFVVSHALPLSLWYDVDLRAFGINIFFTAIYGTVLWFVFTGGKRGRRVFLVSDQVL